MTSKTTGNRMGLGIAWFRREDWPDLRRVATDGDLLSPNYEDWEDKENTRYNELTSRGVRVHKVMVNLTELIQWCQEQDLHLDAAARSRFAAEKIRRG